MVITTETIIHCDGGQECPLDGEAIHSGDARGESARAQLKGSGWLSKGGKHYCPDCRRAVEHNRQSPVDVAGCGSVPENDYGIIAVHGLRNTESLTD